jgi:D-glycero-alpha-D-manno-heptose-7-phosphate kinase
MLIVRTPLRVSFFGGGTDFPEFFLQNGGAVLGTAINKYIYHTVSHLPSWLFNHTIRFAYRKVEFVNQIDELEHVPFREILRMCGVTRDLEVNLASDLPSFSGLGSSSSFSVGLINGLHAHCNKLIDARTLAHLAINVERNILQETVGMQDQIFAAYGGLNLVRFHDKGQFTVEPFALRSSRLRELDESLMLFFTGATRRAQEIEKKKLLNFSRNERHLQNILDLVARAAKILQTDNDLSEFGYLLDQTWREKRQLDDTVSSNEIDNMYRLGIGAGALGGKLLGAGGGGFMLFFAPKERHESIRHALNGYHEIDFHINAPGSTIIHS